VSDGHLELVEVANAREGLVRLLDEDLGVGAALARPVKEGGAQVAVRGRHAVHLPHAALQLALEDVAQRDLQRFRAE